MLSVSILDISSKIADFKLQLHLTGTNELTKLRRPPLKLTEARRSNALP